MSTSQRVVFVVRHAVLAADRHQHVGAIRVGTRMLTLDDGFGAREQLAGGERLARRRGIGKQELVELVDRRGAGQLAQREVALLGGDALPACRRGCAPSSATRACRVARCAWVIVPARPASSASTASEASATGIRFRRTNLVAR